MTANPTAFIDDLHTWLNIPYSDGPQSKAGFNCWGLMRACLMAAGMNDVQAMAVDFKNSAHVQAQANQQLAKGVWLKLDTPEPFCVVQMSHATIAHHVGVWLPVNNGMILHTTLGTGSILQKRHLVNQLGFHITGYYRFIG